VVSPGNLDLEQKGLLEKMHKANADFMDGLYRTLMEPPVWKIFKTPGYKLLDESHKNFVSLLEGSIDRARNEFLGSPESVKETDPFMYEINSRLSKEDALMLAMETFIGGIDAVKQNM